MHCIALHVVFVSLYADMARVCSCSSSGACSRTWTRTHFGRTSRGHIPCRCAVHALPFPFPRAQCGVSMQLTSERALQGLLDDARLPEPEHVPAAAPAHVHPQTHPHAHVREGDVICDSEWSEFERQRAALFRNARRRYLAKHASNAERGEPGEHVAAEGSSSMAEDGRERAAASGPGHARSQGRSLSPRRGLRLV